jgi:hypothetical protein
MYPGTLPQVIVYEPGAAGADCEIPDPAMVIGPVIVHEEATFEETFTVPGSGQEIVMVPP